MAQDIERIKVDPTVEIDVNEDDGASIEAELKAMTKEELLNRLNFEETDPKVIKLIKQILKTK